MPSLKCYQCGKVKRCQMVMARVFVAVQAPGGPIEVERTAPQYLCSPCARELGYSKDSSR